MGAGLEYERLKSMLASDKINTPAKFNDVVKNDITSVLKNYFDINSNDIILDINKEGGQYIIKIMGRSVGVKSLGVLL